MSGVMWCTYPCSSIMPHYTGKLCASYDNPSAGGMTRKHRKIFDWYQTKIKLKNKRTEHIFIGSPGALGFNLEKKCRKLKFSGMLLGCPLNTLVKSRQKSQRRKIFYSRWPQLPLLPYCYNLKSCNICHKKAFFVHTHVLKYNKHNGIIIPTLVLTLQVKFQYGCHFKVNIINDIRMWCNFSTRSGFPCNPYIPELSFKLLSN